MTTEIEVSELIVATTELLDAVNVRKSVLEDSADAAVDAASSATVSAERAEQAAEEAVQVVTGGTASYEPVPGKIPLGSSTGHIAPGWIPPEYLDASEDAADRSEVSAVRSEGGAVRSEGGAVRAESAADVAQLSTSVYPDTASGIAATTVGQYFSVPGTGADEYLILYRRGASNTAAEVKRYPSALAVLRAQEKTSNSFGNGVYNDVVISSSRPSAQNLTSSSTPTFEYLLSTDGMVLNVAGGGVDQVLFSTNLVNLRGSSRTVLEFRVNSTTAPSTPTGLGVSFAGTSYFWYSHPGTNTSHLRKRVGTGTPVRVTGGGESSLVLAGDTLTVEFILNSSGGLDITFNNGRDTLRYKDSGIAEGPIGIVSNTGISLSVSASRESVSSLVTSQLDDVKLNQTLAVFEDYKVAELPLIASNLTNALLPDFSANHVSSGLEIKLNSQTITTWFDTDIRKPVGGLSGNSTLTVGEVLTPSNSLFGHGCGLVFGDTAYYWYSHGASSLLRKKVSNLSAVDLISFGKSHQEGDVLNIEFSWDASGSIELEFTLGAHSHKLTDVCNGSAVRLFMFGPSTITHAFELDTSVGRLLRTVSRETESPEGFRLEFSAIADPMVSTLTRVSESYPAMVAVKMANDRPNEQPRPIGWLYVTAEAPYRYLYSSGKPDQLKDLAPWNASITFNGNSPPSNYAHFIMKNGDILCVVRGDLQVAASARQNPILYPAGDYNNPVVIDFGGRTKPTAWLQNCGADFLYNEDCLIFAEYTRPVHDRAYVWKVTYPITNPDNWRIVQDFEVGVDVEHLHTISYDPFSGAVLLTSGDSDPESKILLSRDVGETWTVEFEGIEKYCRILNVIWTPDKVYWATDSGFPSKHSLFEASRDVNGYPIFTLESMQERYVFPYLVAQQATYTTAYIRDPHGLLFLDRHDGNAANQTMKVYFWDLDSSTMHVVADLKSLPNARNLGFRCSAVSWYQPEADDRIVCGFNLGVNPNVIDLLGNKTTSSDRVNNLALRVKRA